MHPRAALDACRAIYAYRTAYRKNERLPRAALDLLQKRALERLVGFAKAQSSYYGRLYRDLDPTRFTLAELPTTNKAEMMGHFDEVVTDRRLTRQAVEAYIREPHTPLFLDRYQIVHSGGSSGCMGIVAYESREWRVALAGVMRWMAFMGVPTFRIPRYRVASIGGVGKTYASYKLSTGLDIGAANKKTLSAAADLDELIPILNDFQPQLLTGVASVIGALARAQEEGRLRMRPAIVATYAETKSAALQEAILRVWGVRAFEQYSMIELLSLSCDCAEHRIHLFDDLGIVEVVDRENRPVPDGQPGERILITNLYNFTQPIIRYEIDDIVALDPTPCPCGRAFRTLQAVRGRSSDVLELKKHDGGWTQLTLLNVLDLAKEWLAIGQIRIVREKQTVTVQLVLQVGAAQDEITAGLAQRLVHLLEERGVIVPEIRVEVVSGIPRLQASGKTRMIEDRGEA